MKLQPHYNEIKQLIFDGLESKGKSIDEVKIYFKDLMENSVNGDFNRACVWTGSQLTRAFWQKKLMDLYKQDINDNHVKTLYKKFFKELGFNQ